MVTDGEGCSKIARVMESPVASSTKKILARVVLATVAYAATLGILLQLHDYPQLLRQLALIRANDPIAVQRKWLVGFYFLNEAASGIKFFLTGNAKHFNYYPSGSHLLAHRIAHLQDGDWQMQLQIARMHYCAFAGLPYSRAQAFAWLARAQAVAPAVEQDGIINIIQNVRTSPSVSPLVCR